ncbi:type II toxin-antitoxin system HipA family toxin [Photobacterium galatheae]|uniref:Toxin HipA n=1 Tax=Photobacterium galatheae TaxID=1654360 RepID=A0A066RPD8_9GAMM|nr:type II toxin-antitoxin system HipA family toxin [Photobacterium galatheae]KDM90991.1 toxin HipA [Photobacterium galatheae]MCM0149053.1 type II toxin-antitoxin system HipA family toxin [Photobacterium galatheae]
MEIFVYADWIDTEKPMRVGTLRSSQIRGHEHFSFTYDPVWLTSPYIHQIDPALHLYMGEQHATDDRNFKVFLDSCPDRWGRLLMQRREAVIARNEQRRARKLFETDYLLGVHDSFRMGALRFCTSHDGPFLDNNDDLAAPAITSLPELQQAANGVEDKPDFENPDYLKWLNMLISPGSSLGGARPKASVREVDNSLWLAKFPSRYDEYDIGLWEFVVYQMALAAGITMAESKVQSVGTQHHIFLTKRFDRLENGRRLHFTSAMTQLEYFDGHDDGASYLELAEFLIQNGSNTQEDLEQLWTRILFNIMVSNSDDHLRNHGFIFDTTGWRLSPAYDINPTLNATGLHLNIDDVSNALEVDLAFEVAEYFQVDAGKQDEIYQKVKNAVSTWEILAKQAGISKGERDLLRDCFWVPES